MTEATTNTLSKHLQNYTEKLLHNHILRFENEHISCTISYCAVHIKTPFACETIDLNDPEHSHLLFLAANMSQLLRCIPLTLDDFELISQEDTSEASLAHIATFMPNKEN